MGDRTGEGPQGPRGFAPALRDAARRLAAAPRFRLSVLGAATCAVAVAWIDRPLAFAIASVIPPAEYVPNVPDVLDPLVVAVSVAAILVWRAARARGDERLARATMLVALVGPVALGLKDAAKWVFGRPGVALMLHHPRVGAFHWLAGHGGYKSFPSGHMFVATAWVVVVLGVYPRLRPLGRAALLVLAAALILGSFHFLGDVIAGTVLGAAVGWAALGLVPSPAVSPPSEPPPARGRSAPPRG